MRIYNATYKNVTLDWENVTLPINEGSPISADGKVSNDSDAIGLCPRYIWQEPLENKTVPILIGGDVVLPEVEAEYGESLTDDAIASMGGINFYEDDGSIDKASGGGGGGNMLVTMSQVGDDQVIDKTYADIKNAVESGIWPFMIAGYGEMPFDNIYPVIFYGYADGKYGVRFFHLTGNFNFTFLSDTEDGVMIYDPES